MRSVDDAVIGRRGGELAGLAAPPPFGVSAPPAALLVAIAVFGEHLDRRSMLGSAAVIAGAGLLGGAPGEGGTGWAGVGLIAGAAVLWAVDNNVSRDVATRPPLALVTTKCAP